MTDNSSDLLLILGTDAAGKDYVGNLAVEFLHRTGGDVEKRAGWFSGRHTFKASSEEKGRVALFLESVFLYLFPVAKGLIPVAAALFLNLDLLLFKRKEKNIVVVSHTVLRLLAFYMGHTFSSVNDIALPTFLSNTLSHTARVADAKVIVLDVEHDVRHERIKKRAHKGKMDRFDAYMAKNSLLSEKIEEYLVWLGTRYFDAHYVENNNLSRKELEDFLTEVLKKR